KEEGEDWPNGRVTWVSTTKVPFRDREGRVIGTFGISRDVTAHRAMEVALKQRTEELARSNAELEQFANIISHDLNEPLRTVTGFLQLLAKRYHGQLTHEADEFIDFAVQGGRRMRNLLNDLLMYSRVTTKAQPFEPTEAKSILDQARANLEVAIQQARAEITHDPLPRIMGDETQLIQLFQNLFANAIKFHGAKDPEVRVSARETPEGWEFQVRDNGIGIDPENFERIFQIFQRVSGDETISGTGIGLAVCDKIVKRHGGRIWVESEPDKGSTFHFTLPPAKAEE
ncbi:PAS domain-containing protein, partial [bacterium]|nr:PAS domain-containing protein [bacterium]